MTRSARPGSAVSSTRRPTDFDFPRAVRLLDAESFQAAFRSGKRFPNADLIVIARPNGLAFARLGFAVGRKAVPRAVARNRIKRVTRESFRHHHDALPGVDIVLLARRGLDQRSNASLFTLLSEHWRKLAERYRTPNG
ncbi:MAG: ribonuclease P protein component [Gammaproteobacteria bacterium]